MKTELEIKNKIKKHEGYVGQLLDQQQESSNASVIMTLGNNIDVHRLKIEQLQWVLNE